MNVSRLILILCTSFSVSYAQLVEDFSSGSLMNPRLWQGTSSYFKVNTALQLQSDGPSASSTLFLQTGSEVLHHAVWRCWLKMDFPSSTTNYAKIMLAASSTNLLDPSLEAYYVKVGGLSGATDGIDLYYQKGASHTRIIKGIEGRAGADVVELQVQVTCDAEGNWSLYSDTTRTHDFQLEGRAKHFSIFHPKAFGVLCVHSSTRRDKFYFDDMLIDPHPFLLTSIEAVDKHTLTVEFTESLDLYGIKGEHVLLDGSPLQFDDRIDVSGRRVSIHLKRPLTQGHHTLVFPGVKSVGGKALQNTGSFDFSFLRIAKALDLLITEIMADPDPAVGLPSVEYIELYNTTLDTLWLGAYRFGDPSTKAVFPSYSLGPQQRLIVTSTANTTLFNMHGNTLGISPWPSLNNDQDSLFLLNSLGVVIDEVVYQTSLLNDPKKKSGGWAMEMKHLTEHCRGFLNWSYSENVQGGTPGSVNSLMHRAYDRSPPRCMASYFNALEGRAELFFDEPLGMDFLPLIVRLDNEKKIIPSFGGVQRLTFPLLLAEGDAVRIDLQGVKDCLGNAQSISIELNNPKPVSVGDVEINEVLFNPHPYGVDFVELYNNTDAFIKLDGLLVKNRDEKEVTLHALTMSPRSYKVLTADSMKVKEFYPYAGWGTFVKISLPPLPDDQGLIALYGSRGELLDYMAYKEEQHHPFLESKEGISLERVDLQQASEITSNWLSASITSGGATPGYSNSQSAQASADGAFYILPQTISPGTDGYRNYARIHYRTAQPATSVRADVYTLDGNWVCALQAAGPADVQGFCVWDGTDERKQPVATGLYLVVLDFLQPDGIHYKRKGTIGVLSP